MNELINYKGVYRTAPAKPGVLNILLECPMAGSELARCYDDRTGAGAVQCGERPYVFYWIRADIGLWWTDDVTDSYCTGKILPSLWTVLDGYCQTSLVNYTQSATLETNPHKTLVQSLVQWAQHPYRMFYTGQRILDWSSRMSVLCIRRAVCLYGRMVELYINVWYNPSSKAVKSCLEAPGLRAQPEPYISIVD